MKSSEQFAIEWNRSKRAINDLCNKGKIPGAIKEGRKWLIPDDAVRPVDKRVSSGKYAKKKAANNKPLPIGISDYVRAQADYYYVDKTLLIKEFLDQKPLVSLFTRPRRFGKTLNMDMLRVFLRFQRRIQVNISRIKQSGDAVKNIADSRDSIQLYSLLSKMLSLIPGKQLLIRLKIFCRRSLEDIRRLRIVIDLQSMKRPILRKS